MNHALDLGLDFEADTAFAYSRFASNTLSRARQVALRPGRCAWQADAVHEWRGIRARAAACKVQPSRKWWRGVRLGQPACTWIHRPTTEDRQARSFSFFYFTCANGPAVDEQCALAPTTEHTRAVETVWRLSLEAAHVYALVDTALRPSRCPACDGRGWSASASETCEICLGTGGIWPRQPVPTRAPW